MTKTTSQKRYTNFKKYCIENNISQKDLMDKTCLSAGCIHTAWNDGKASKSTIKLFSLTLGLEESNLRELITTFHQQEA